MKHDVELYDEISSSEDWVSNFYDEPGTDASDIALENSQLAELADENSLTFINVISFILNPPPTVEAPLNKTREILNQTHFNSLKPVSDNFLGDLTDLKAFLPVESSHDVAISEQAKLYLSDSNLFTGEPTATDKLEDYTESFWVEKPTTAHSFGDIIIKKPDGDDLNSLALSEPKQDTVFEFAETQPDFASINKTEITENSQLVGSSYQNSLPPGTSNEIEIEKTSQSVADPKTKETFALQEREFQAILENQEPLLTDIAAKDFSPNNQLSKFEFYKTQTDSPDAPSLENAELVGVFENLYDTKACYSDAISDRASPGIDFQELNNALNTIFEKDFDKLNPNIETMEHSSNKVADFQATNGTNLGIFDDKLADLTKNKSDLPTYSDERPYLDNQASAASILNDNSSVFLADNPARRDDAASYIFSNLPELIHNSNQNENFETSTPSIMQNQETDSLLDTEKTLVRSALADLKAENREQYIEYSVPENWFRDNAALKYEPREPDILSDKNSSISPADKLKIEIEGNLKILEDGRARITGIGFGAIPGR